MPPKPAWQPIETAPRDGTDVWLYVPPLVEPYPECAVQCCAGFSTSWGRWCISHAFGRDLETGIDDRQPTHWMPLPEPPEGEAE